MPRDESYLLRLTKPEKDELARRAKEQGISIAKLIRQRLDLDASGKESLRKKFEKDDALLNVGPDRSPEAPLIEQPASPPDIQDRLLKRVNEHSQRMPRSNAERLARKELG